MVESTLMSKLLQVQGLSNYLKLKSFIFKLFVGLTFGEIVKNYKICKLRLILI